MSRPSTIAARRTGALSSSGPPNARVLVMVLPVAAFLAAGWALSRTLPPTAWLGALLHADATDAAELIFRFAVLPRLVVAILAGAALAASGTLLQHVLDNPLAAPSTLGVTAGGQLGMIVATLWAPALLALWPDAPALVGGLAAAAVALGIAAPLRFTPTATILAATAVGLFCGALGHALKLLDGEYLGAVLLWNAGVLDQTDWSAVTVLLPRLALLIVPTLLLVRPLDLLGLGEAGARGLGLPTSVVRAAAVAVAVGYAAVVVASVGTVGFVDLAAPLMARIAGARRLRQRLLVAPAIGAALLVIVDAVVQAVNDDLGMALPTGAVTAALAAPLMLWLIPRLRTDPRAGAAPGLGTPHRRPVTPLFAALTGLAAATFVLSCAVGVSGAALGDIVLSWRLPRAVEAFAAGALLASAGTILQRTAGNMLASPDLLGLGAAVTAGVAAVLFLAPEPPGALALLSGGAGGALLEGALLFGGGRRARFAPDHVLLRGVALTAALQAGVTACLALNDARTPLLLRFMAGSTAEAGGGGAIALVAAVALLLPAALLFARVLDVLPLGDAAARGLGVDLGPARAALMGFAALQTAAAVMAVGPLSFVGLVGPHLARRLGFTGALAELPGAALIGGLVMLVADWVGRVALGPFELPAGLVAALIGCPYLVFQLRRRGSPDQTG